MVFETYQAPAVFVAKDAVLSCFANARGTAVVYDCGATVTTATPVHNGYAIQKAIVKSNIGGNLLDAEMLKQVQYSAAPNTTSIAPHLCGDCCVRVGLCFTTDVGGAISQ